MKHVPCQQLIVPQPYCLQGAVSYAMYNTIDPENPVGLSRNPLRMLLDPYMDPTYSTEFLSAFFMGKLPPPPTPLLVPALPSFWDLYAKAGPFGPVTLHACHPRELLSLSGLNKGQSKPAANTLATLHCCLMP